MKTTNEIKKWLKEKFGMVVKGNTSAGKSKWQSFYVPADKSTDFRYSLVYTLPEFPAEFRQLCIRTIYPNAPTLHVQTSAGNVEKYSVAMLPFEWETVMKEWETTHA